MSDKFKEPIQICAEFYEPLVKFMLANKKKKERVVFRKINNDHIEFFKQLMNNSKTKNLTLG